MPATRDQQRGEAMHGRVQAIQSKKGEAAKEWGRWAHKLPILIRQAGLAQALAFADAKGKDGGKQLLEDLAATMGARLAIEPANREGLLKASRSWELAKYQLLTRESLATLVWAKRFAQSVLGEDGTSDAQ